VFAQRAHGSADSRLQTMYELGLVDFVSIRWSPTCQQLLWRKQLSPEGLAFYLPVFLSGISSIKVRQAEPVATCRSCMHGRKWPQRGHGGEAACRSVCARMPKMHRSVSENYMSLHGGSS
jgi:hypothetical protein